MEIITSEELLVLGVAVLIIGGIAYCWVMGSDSAKMQKELESPREYNKKRDKKPKSCFFKRFRLK